MDTLKLLVGNSFLTGLVIVVIIAIVLFFAFIAISKPHKWPIYIALLLALLVTIPSILYAHEYFLLNKKPSVFGGMPKSAPDYDDIFSMNHVNNYGNNIF